MKNNFFKESLVAAILVVLLILLINPMHLWMPSMAHETILVCLFLFFGLFSVFVMSEKVRDERDVLHRMLSARAAFFTGTSIIAVGIFVQERTESIDIWLVVALVAMILAKIGTRFYADKNL